MSRPTPLEFKNEYLVLALGEGTKNEYLVLALGEGTAAQAVVGSIVWSFRGLKKAEESGDERPRLRAS